MRAARRSARSATSRQVGKLFAVLGPRYASVTGGYIRVLKAVSVTATTRPWRSSSSWIANPSEKGKDSGPVAETFGD